MRAYLSHSMPRSISFASAAFVAASLVSMTMSEVAFAEPAGSPTASEADNQLARRCESGSKQEHCFWVKLGVQPTSQR